MYDIEQLRQTEFPISQNYIYFNHAGISPLPLRSQRRVAWAAEQLSAHPLHFWAAHGAAISEQLKQQLAAYVNAADPLEFVPTDTTSTGINTVAQALPWQPGDTVLVGSSEFPANMNPWLNLAQYGVTVCPVTAVSGGVTVADLQPHVDNHTRLVAVSAIQFFTGHKSDLLAIGQFCHAHNLIFVVDGIQAMGHMPIDVQAMHIDALASGGQKSILGLPGGGFLYVRQGLAEQMQPRYIGGNATENYLHWLDYDLTPLSAAQRFSSGTPNLLGIIALSESLTLLTELGVENIAAHTAQLADHASDTITQLGFDVITPRAAHGPIVTFASGRTAEETDALIGQLDRHGVAVVKHLDAAGNPHIRLSFHCYNTAVEIDCFADIMHQIM